MKTAPKNILQEGKPKPSIIPMDILMKVLEPAYQEGIIKYYRESWRIGFLTSDMFDAAMRHLIAYYYDKEDYDKDSEKQGIKKLHLGGVLFSVLCMCDTLLNHPELDDRGKDYSPSVNKEFEFMDEPREVSEEEYAKLLNYQFKSKKNKMEEL
jgi:hypothetical protein